MMTEEKRYRYAVHATGWWQQDGCLREPIEDIQIFFYEDRFSGSGRWPGGYSVLKGTPLENGRLTIRKVDGSPPNATLTGRHDGEGLMWGRWESAEATGSWEIRVERHLKFDPVPPITILDPSAMRPKTNGPKS